MLFGEYEYLSKVVSFTLRRWPEERPAQPAQVAFPVAVDVVQLEPAGPPALGAPPALRIEYPTA